jgi:Bacterial membrane protein YfhO
MYLSTLSTSDPISWTANITHYFCRVACGRPMIDPNVGFLTQPLGHLAAMDLLHGHFPWWNYFQGLGQPLAGEMQSAALFPLTLLFALPSGLLLFHVSLEVIAGVSTYFFVKKLGISSTFATAGGMLFALNGTFAWLGNAVLNPVAFLPMLLLGIELIIEHSQDSKKSWYVASIALALSLYSGFPEVAYFNGLFCIAWTVIRLYGLEPKFRLHAFKQLSISGVVGIILSLPILVPFMDFLKVAIVGDHSAAIDGVSKLSTHAVPMFFDPYIYGTLFSNLNVQSEWGSIGGYFTISVTLLAIFGLFGKKLRAQRMFLFIWILIGTGGALNTFGLRTVWNLIPLVSSASFARYIAPSIEIAMILLAIFGLYDFETLEKTKKKFLFAGVISLAILLLCHLDAHSLNLGVALGHKARFIFIGLQAIPFIAVILLISIALFVNKKHASKLLVLIIVGESILYFFVPTAEAPKQIILDKAPIEFLQQHEGSYRYLDFGVLYPNWGTQFGLNELSSIDLPFPKLFSQYIQKNLYQGMTPENQFLVHSGITGMMMQQQQLLANFSAYENVSVKYLLMLKEVPLLGSLTNLGVVKVFTDDKVSIYELPHPRPFFSTSTNCSVTQLNVDSATVTCPTASSVIRTELFMKGWSATVNGQPVPITKTWNVAQTVAVPAGTSVVNFKFMPPHEKFALLVAFLAFAYLCGSRFFSRRKKSQFVDTPQEK